MDTLFPSPTNISPGNLNESTDFQQQQFESARRRLHFLKSDFPPLAIITITPK